MPSLLRRPSRLLVLTIAVAAAVGVSAAGVAQAATRTVCAVGCDDTTVQSAVNHAVAGDTVQVAAGTYNEAVTIDKPLTLRGDPAGERPTVQLPDGTAGVLQITANDVTVQHLHLVKNDQASDTGIVTIPRGGSWPSYTIAYGNITLRDLLVEKGRRGAYITGHDVTVESSSFDLQTRDTLFFNAAAGTTRIVGNSFGGNSATSKKAIIFENFSSADPATSGTIDVERNVTSGKNNFLLYDQWVDPSQTVSLVVKGNRLAGLGSNAIVVFDPRPFDASFPAASFAKIASVAVHANDFSGVASLAQAVTTVPEAPVDATGNWWGCNAGPGNAGCALASAGVTTSPNLVLTVATDQSSLTTGQTATLTARLTQGSNGADLSSQGVVLDGRTVVFSASAGALSAASAALASGVAAVSLTSAVAGTVSLTASLDGAAVPATVAFVAPAQTPASPTPEPAPASPTPAPAPAPVVTPVAAPAAAAVATPPPPVTPVVNVPVTTAATPGTSGSATVAVSPPAAQPGTTVPPALPVTVGVSWTPATFAAFATPVTVTVTPRAPTLTTATTSPGTAGAQTPTPAPKPAPLPPVLTSPQGGAGSSGVGYALGSAIVQLNVTTTSGDPVTSFAAPLQIRISADGAGDLPAYSRDGTAWTAIPQLASPELPVGQPDGYYANADGSIDIYTRHATYFGLLQDVQAPAPPAGVRGSVKAGRILVGWTASTDNGGKIAGYQLLLGTLVIARLSGSAISVTTTVKYPTRPSRFTVRAVDSAGNVSSSSRPLVVAPQPRPTAAPGNVPAAAWRLLSWQERPAAGRGPRPKAVPGELPAWFSAWAAWRRQPFRIVG